MRNLNSVPEAIRTDVRNQGGGHYNHSLFWQMLKRDGGQPKGELLKAIEKRFGGVDGFKDAFTKLLWARFVQRVGRGWCWTPTGSWALWRRRIRIRR